MSDCISVCSLSHRRGSKREREAAENTSATGAAATIAVPLPSFESHVTSRTRLAEPAAAETADATSAWSHAASTAVPSPASRCDSDSLSVILSCLNTADFLFAIRVSRRWRAVAMKQTAWPKFDLQAFIEEQWQGDRALIPPAARQLDVTFSSISLHDHLLKNSLFGSFEETDGASAAVVSNSSPSPGSAFWRNVTDVCLQTDRSAGQFERDCLRGVSRLPHIRALTLKNSAV
jgi:hypothetical protein